MNEVPSCRTEQRCSSVQQGVRETAAGAPWLPVSGRVRSDCAPASRCTAGTRAAQGFGDFLVKLVPQTQEGHQAYPLPLHGRQRWHSTTQRGRFSARAEHLPSNPLPASPRMRCRSNSRLTPAARATASVKGFCLTGATCDVHRDSTKSS